MSFLSDYLLYNEGNECHRLFHLWTGHVLLAAAAGNRIFVDNGYQLIYPNLYATLVGKQGEQRKSTAKDIGRDLFEAALPDYPIGASVQSCNDIIKNMSSDDGERSFVNHEGASVSWRPIVFFVNELKNFLSINPAQMIDFLTDIYDRNGRVFNSSTIKHGLQDIENPCVNVLACETPDWIVERLRFKIISGGFSRRMIYVYVTEAAPRIAFPKPTEEGKAALKRCLEHLKRVPTFTGQFQWEDSARTFYKEWYDNIKYPDDPVLAGYFSSKHVQLLKVCMGLAIAEPKPQLLITKEWLELALSFLELTETNLPRLSIAAGRNELAVPQQNILDLLEANGGAMGEREFLRKLDKELSPLEKSAVIENLRKSETIIKVPDVNWPSKDTPKRTLYFLPETLAKWKVNGGK